jgi:hypothetical protein
MRVYRAKGLIKIYFKFYKGRSLTMNLLKGTYQRVKNLSMVAKTGIMATAISLGTTVITHAAEGDLDPAVQTAISGGFTSAGKAIAVIVGLGVTATVGVIAVSGGAKAGLKWVKGVFAKAS